MLCSIFDIQQIFTEVHTNFNKIIFLFSKKSETATCLKSGDGWVKASGNCLEFCLFYWNILVSFALASPPPPQSTQYC